MADEFKFPSLADLERSHPDYPTKLEHGIMGIEESLQVEHARANDLGNRSSEDLIAKLRDIGGVTVNDAPELAMNLDLGCGHGLSVSTYTVNSTGLAARRRVEDITRESARELRANVEASEDRMRELQRAHADFREAALDLTEVTPLNNIDGIPTSLHLYIERGDKIYEGHIDLESTQMTPPSENPRLRPEYFTDRETKAGFGSEASRLKAEAYLVKNPVGLVPYQILFAKAGQDVVRAIMGREAESDERKPGYVRLVDGIQRAINYFRSGSTRA